MFGLSPIEIIYWISTIVGGTLFILRTALMLAGGLGGGELDAEVPDDSPADPDFKLLSVQGLTSFFMMFGLVGLALLKAGVPALLTIGGGVLAGLVSVWLTAILYSQMKRLQSDGTVDIRNAIGQQGSVYLTIPAGKSGQVQVAVQGSLRIFDAIAKNGRKIATGQRVRVVDVTGTNTLVVELDD
jgi:membrane protein implicated in regulation of membrane protease activity